MNTRTLSRRSAIGRLGLLVSAAVLSRKAAGANATPASARPATERPFRFSLNTATIRGQKLGIVKEVELASQAGYDGLEPWIDSLETYVKEGGSLPDLKKRIADAGLTIEGAIGFPEWIVDNPERRNKGMERAKREMDLVAQIGGRRFAAPPAGATALPKLDPLDAAARYRELLLAGDQIGVVPQLELWGFSKNLNRLSECVAVAMETGHPKACVLADVFHLYKGGSDFHGLHLLGSTTVQVLHMNDFPAEPPRDKIDDSFRMFPGDGVAPLPELLQTLRRTGGQKVLSLELFNRKYWAQEPSTVLKTGLEKMRTLAEKTTA